MAKIKAPLFSLDATGTLDKNITYKENKQNKIAQKYSKPGSANPFESSPRQKDQRSIIRLITIHWQCMTDLDKLSWETAAKDARFKGTGYHYFLHMAQQNLTQYLGLVGYWSMNYNIDDKIPDLSGNCNHGILSPIFPCDCPTLVNSFDKKHGKAALFDGLDDFLLIVDSTLLTPDYITLESWVKIVIDPLPVDQHIISCDDVINRSYQFRISTDSLPKIIVWRVSDGTFCSLPGTTVLLKDTWYYISGTWDGSTVNLYVNGKLDNSLPFAGTLQKSPTKSVYFGRRFDRYLSGIIDDLIIYNRALSLEEIQKHYNLLN